MLNVPDIVHRVTVKHLLQSDVYNSWKRRWWLTFVEHKSVLSKVSKLNKICKSFQLDEFQSYSQIHDGKYAFIEPIIDSKWVWKDHEKWRFK